MLKGLKVSAIVEDVLRAKLHGLELEAVSWALCLAVFAFLDVSSLGEAALCLNFRFAVMCVISEDRLNSGLGLSASGLFVGDISMP
jgi:hypothetical protein